MPPLLKLILIRIGLGVLTLFLVSVVVFVATQALPGDTARAILGREAANVDRYEALKEQLGLNKPMAEQYLSWLGGVVVVEYLFAFPGIGSLLVDAVANRDMPMVQAITLIIAAVYVVANLTADILTILVSPRLRTGLR